MQKTVILIGTEKMILGAVALSDVLRENAKDTMKNLHSLGLNTVLLTGDNKLSANYFAKEAGIKDVFSEVLPEEKLDIVKKLQKDNVVCMIGDGINDAPALKTADVSIAMGKLGSDIAVESADMVLISDDISKISYLKKLSNITVNTIKSSIKISLLISIIAVLLSPTGLLNPLAGALIHNLGTVIVVINATLLYDKKI